MHIWQHRLEKRSLDTKVMWIYYFTSGLSFDGCSEGALDLWMFELSLNMKFADFKQTEWPVMLMLHVKGRFENQARFHEKMILLTGKYLAKDKSIIEAFR